MSGAARDALIDEDFFLYSPLIVLMVAGSHAECRISMEACFHHRIKNYSEFISQNCMLLFISNDIK